MLEAILEETMYKAQGKMPQFKCDFEATNYSPTSTRQTSQGVEVLTLGLLLAHLSYPVRQEGLKSLRKRGEVSQDFRGERRGGRSLFKSPAFRVCVDQ